jgi:tagatose kinase
VEALGVDELRKVAKPVIERASLILPSDGEAKNIMGTETDEEACQLLVRQGKLVVQKRGKAGCRIYSAGQIIEVPSFELEEVDPTGAGDTFCAAFINGLIGGMPLYDIGLFSNAAAALSITKKGPMEGAPSRAEVEDLINTYKNKGE